LSKRLAAAHEKGGQHFISAPVFGRPEAAAAGKLFIVVGGAAQVITTCMPALESMAQRVFVMSDRPEAANLVKISGNFLIASVIEALGEAFALVGKGGVDRSQYLELLTSTLFNAPVYKTYGGLIVEGKFEPVGFSALLGQKDVHLALSAADTLSVPMPIASLLRDRFLTLIASGGEALDWSAIGQLAARDAGIGTTVL
jgi:3-hydroxyisobutyrate dehydrogenase-like beta-hydroxyacid dehydrogenase